MSAKHPIVAITGSSGAGTSSVTRTFENIFRRENVSAAIIEGDSYHRYDRAEMKKAMAEAEAGGRPHFSHFGEDANLFAELEQLFRDYSESGSGRSRKYLHNDEEAAPYQQPAGTFTPWEPLPDSELLFYEGLHGGVKTEHVDVSRYADLLIGVVPVINLEWIQKIHRDRSTRGYSTEAVTDVILRRMHDYVHYICPQFTRTHINFQRVPVVDTSNPFIARDVPTQEGNDHPTSAPMGLFQCADGAVNIGVSGEGQWREFCEAIERLDWLERPEFRLNADRVRNRSEINATVQALFSTQPVSHWVELLNRSSIPCGPVYTVPEMFEDEQVRHLGVAAPVVRPDGSTIRVISQPVTLERTPATLQSSAPRIGEHSSEILREVGYSDEEIGQLEAEGVI